MSSDTSFTESAPLAGAAVPDSRPLRPVDWTAIAASPAFRALLRAKRRAVVPMLAASLIYFLAVTLLAGFARPLMTQHTVGGIGLGYVLIIAMYVICWLAAIAYVVIADRDFDPRARAVIEAVHRGEPS